MWRTRRGIRALRPAEWQLFQEGIGRLWDSIEMCCTFQVNLRTGVEVFDRLQPNQKLAMLVRVGTALRDTNVPAPRADRPDRGTVAAVFQIIKAEVAVEIDLEEDVRCDQPESADVLTLRRLIVAACREWEDHRRYKFPAETSEAGATWDYLIEDFALPDPLGRRRLRDGRRFHRRGSPRNGWPKWRRWESPRTTSSTSPRTPPTRNSSRSALSLMELTGRVGGKPAD